MDEIKEKILEWVKSDSPEDYLLIIAPGPCFLAKHIRVKFISDVRKAVDVSDELLNVAISYTACVKGNTFRSRDVIQIVEFLKRKQADTPEKALITIKEALSRRRNNTP